MHLLHAVATACRAVTVGELTEWLGISQSTCSHHVRKLADVEFVLLRKSLHSRWLPGHRWIAEIDGVVAGWAALAPLSTRDCYSGVAEHSLCVGVEFRGRGVGKTLLHKLITAADSAGLWTLQTAICPENRASLALHHSAGFRTLGGFWWSTPSRRTS